MIGDDVIDGSGVDAEVDSTNWPWGATKVLFPTAGHLSGNVKSNTSSISSTKKEVVAQYLCFYQK